MTEKAVMEKIKDLKDTLKNQIRILEEGMNEEYSFCRNALEQTLVEKFGMDVYFLMDQVEE